MNTRITAVLITLVVSGCFLFTNPPQDARLIEAFVAHRSSFEELAAFCRRYPSVTRIGRNFTNPSDLSQVGISAQQLERVRRLMREAGCGDGFVRKFGSGGTMFIFYAEGLPSGRVVKGLSLMDGLPNTTEANLDHYGWGTNAGKRAFRKIEGEWFVYFERD